jgi:hypothetical protein
MHTNKKALTTLLLALVLCSFAFSVFVSAQDSNLNAAENAISEAFNAVLEAEKTGQDITSLLDQLDTASGLLSDAKNAYRSGNIESTASYANQIIQIVNTVKAQAETLKEEGIKKSQVALIEAVVVSVVGIIACLVAFFFGWKFFKKAYLKRMMTWTPEINTHESQ